MKKLSIVLALLLMCTVVLGSCGTKEETPYDYDLKEYVKLGAFPNVEVDEAAIQKEVDKQVETVASKHKETKEVDREIKKGDIANIDYVGKIAGEEFEGGSAKGHDLTIGSGSFIAGFEDGLIGKKKGEEVVLKLKFEESYDNADVAGKDVEFTVKINKVSEETIPALTDKMVSELNASDYKTVSEFLDFHRKSAAESMVWENYVASCKVIKYPETETKEYYDQQVSYWDYLARMQGYTLEEYALAIGYTTLDELYAGFLVSARSTVKEEMIVYSTVRTHNIKISDEEYKEGALELATENGYPSLEEFEKNATKKSIMFELYRNKIVDYILEENELIKDFADVPVEDVPEDTTAAPEDTTAAPEDTTATPEDTTAAPEDTTATPEDTTTTPEA